MMTRHARLSKPNLAFQFGLFLALSTQFAASGVELTYQSTSGFFSEFFGEVRKVKDARRVSLFFAVEGTDISDGSTSLDCEASARVGVLAYSKGARVALRAEILDLDGNTLEDLGKKSVKVRKSGPGRISFPITALQPGDSFLVRVEGRWRKKKDADRVETTCAVSDGQPAVARTRGTKSLAAKTSSATTSIGIAIDRVTDEPTREPPPANTIFAANFGAVGVDDSILLQISLDAADGDEPVAGVEARGQGMVLDLDGGGNGEEIELVSRLRTSRFGAGRELFNLTDQIPQLAHPWASIGWGFKRRARSSSQTLIRITATLVEVPGPDI